MPPPGCSPPWSIRAHEPPTPHQPDHHRSDRVGWARGLSRGRGDTSPLGSSRCADRQDQLLELAGFHAQQSVVDGDSSGLILSIGTLSAKGAAGAGALLQTACSGQCSDGQATHSCTTYAGYRVTLRRTSCPQLLPVHRRTYRLDSPAPGDFPARLTGFPAADSSGECTSGWGEGF